MKVHILLAPILLYLYGAMALLSYVVTLSHLSNYYVLHCFLLVLVVVCTTTMFLFVEVFSFLCPCMAINVSVQSRSVTSKPSDGGT